jgi:ABC-type multidrug transport system ATPase subunit
MYFFLFLAPIGYCPQFVGINESLTGHEMLELFANLRGVSKHNIDNEVKKWISLMGEWWNWTQATVKSHIQQNCLFLGSFNITSSTA